MRSIRRLPYLTGLRPQAPVTEGGCGSTSLLVVGVRLRRDLGGWDATRDFWWIAGRECFLELTVQLVINFSLFALLARFILLWHCDLRFELRDCAAAIRPQALMTPDVAEWTLLSCAPVDDFVCHGNNFDRLLLD